MFRTPLRRATAVPIAATVCILLTGGFQPARGATPELTCEGDGTMTPGATIGCRLTGAQPDAVVAIGAYLEVPSPGSDAQEITLLDVDSVTDAEGGLAFPLTAPADLWAVRGRVTVAEGPDMEGGTVIAALPLEITVPVGTPDLQLTCAASAGPGARVGCSVTGAAPGEQLVEQVVIGQRVLRYVEGGRATDADGHHSFEFTMPDDGAADATVTVRSRRGEVSRTVRAAGPDGRPTPPPTDGGSGGGGSQLPATGIPVGPAGVGLALMATGALVLRRSRPSRTRP